MSAVKINGLPLPDALRAAIEDGRWAPPADDVLARVFGDEPQGASFYSLDYMAEENRAWPGVEDGLPIYLGSPDPSAPPGDIDPRASVLIGDLGYDMPFALDFRTSREEPRVVYLSLETGRWVTVAPTAASLLDRLGLGGR
jgi:SMI1/KNR4 family protein SUKH-1